MARGRTENLAARLAAITWAMTAALVVGIAITIGSALAGPQRDAPELTVFYALFWFPTLFYLAGLAAIARAFHAVGRGYLFAPSLSQGLRAAGSAFAVGGVINLITIHILHSAELPRGFADGKTQVFTGIKFDPAYAVMVLVGVALILIARLLDVALAERQRADRLESELGEFL